MIRTVNAIRYVTPLREGGSLPAIMEADDGALYALKFHGAGQGPRALIAELVAGEIGRALGLPVPEIVFVTIDEVFGRSEPDPEIQELIMRSAGLNLGLLYLSGALAFDPLLAPPPGPKLASEIVWFDAYVTNVDRTPRNTNLLIWQDRLWMIDHGAALIFHHTWKDYRERSRSRFAPIREHVLLPLASEIPAADAALADLLTPDRIRAIVDLVPDAWLLPDAQFADPAAQRAAYVEYLLGRLHAPRGFVEEALHARDQHL